MPTDAASASPPSNVTAPAPRQPATENASELHTSVGPDDDDGSDDDDAEGERTSSVTAGAEADLNSRFIWRGLAESRGAALQPSAWAGLYGLTATVWSSVSLVYEPPHNRFSVSAADASLAYTFALGRFGLEPEISYYYWSSDEAPASTVEAGLKATYKVGAVTLVSANNVDIKTQPGAYFGTLGFEYERAIRRWTLHLGFDAGWATSQYNRAYFALDVSTVNLVEGSLSIRHDLTSLLYFTTHIEVSTLVALPLQRAVQEPTLVNGGTSFGIDY